MSYINFDYENNSILISKGKRINFNKIELAQCFNDFNIYSFERQFDSIEIPNFLDFLEQEGIKGELRFKELLEKRGFKAQAGEILDLLSLENTGTVYLGLGDRTPEDLRLAGFKLVKFLEARKIKSVNLDFGHVKTLDTIYLVEGFYHGIYLYNRYRADKTQFLPEIGLGEFADEKEAEFKPEDLMKELEESGEKYSGKDVIFVVKQQNGKLAWLEEGNDGAGWKHIKRHIKDFREQGIDDEDSIVDLLREAILTGKMIGYQKIKSKTENSIGNKTVGCYIYDHIGTGKDRFHNHPSGKYPKFIYDQDDVQLYGGDLEATMTPLKGLTVVGKAEWMFARNITRGDWLPFMPSDRYGLSGTYERSLGAKEKYHTSLSLSGLYVTKQRRFDPDKDLVSDSPDAYFLLNGTAEFAIRLPQRREVRFMIVGENILNNLYKEYTDRFRYYAHERGVNVSLRTLFKF